MDEKKKRRKGPRTVIQIAPLLQVMPEHRVRIDPAAVPDLVCWVLALREQYERTAQLTLSGLRGVLRVRRVGQIAWARAMVEALDAVARSLHGTLDLRAIDRVRGEWDSALTTVGESDSGIRTD